MQKLIAQCKKHNKKAQKRLYDRYASLMLGICMRYARDRSEAEDMLQDGFVKIFMNIDKYSGTGSFEGWMKRIIVNTAITFYHKHCKHFHHDDIFEWQESISDTHSDTEFTREELFSVINDLSDGYRMVFNLYAIEGYKHKEIAEMLGIEENTSKSQYSRAKKIIQKKLMALHKIQQPVSAAV